MKIFKLCINFLLFIILFSQAAAQHQSVINGAKTTPINFPATGCLYTWTNDAPGIGLPASGSGNIDAFTAVNTGTSPITATITATPVASGFGYIANLSSNTVSVIGTANNSLIATIPVGASPFSVSVNPDGSRAYVVNISSNTVSVIDTKSNKVIATISVGIYPIGSVVSPDGSTLYVSNFNGRSISIINTATNKVSSTIQLNIQPAGLSISPDGGQIYASDSNANTLSIINLSSGIITSTIPVAFDPLTSAVTPDGKLIYVTGQYGQISVIDAVNKVVITTITTNGSPAGLAISPDGKTVYVADPTGQNIYIISTASNIITASISIPTSAQGISISPDGSRLYATDRGNSVFVINTSTNAIVSKITVGSYPESIGNFITPNLTCAGTPITFTITVKPKPVAINAVGTPLPANTSYGTASVSSMFTLSATNLSAGVTVTAPAGFEISTDNITFSNSITVGTGGDVASAVIYARLAAKTNAGTYAGDFVLSSPGAADVHVPIANSVVSRALITITGTYAKYYGDALTDVTLYYNTPNFTFNNAGFRNGESFNSIDIAFGAGKNATDVAGTYTGSVTMSNLTGRDGFLNSNYAISYEPVNLLVIPAPLTITAKNIDKPYGTTLTNTTTTDFTVTGLKNKETIHNVNVAYGLGAAASAAAGVYTGTVTVSAVADGSFVPSNYNITYVPANITVLAAPAPAITSSNPTAVNTIYGTPSASSGFNVSGVNLSSAITISPPAGFEVSTDNINFSNTVTIGSAGNVSPVTVYIRLTAITNAGNYTGNIVLTAGLTVLNIIMPDSKVTAVPVTISAVNTTKTYGNTLTDDIGSTKFIVSSGSLKNGNTINTVVVKYGQGSDAASAVGTYTKAIEPDAVAGGNAFIATNYIITFTSADIIVIPATLVIKPNSQTKNYGTTLSKSQNTTAFLATGLQNNETIDGITATINTGNNAGAPAGNYPEAIIASDGIGGTFTATNYTINYEAADLVITQAPLTIKANDQVKNYGDVNPPLTVTYLGFVNNETESELTKLPALTTNVTVRTDPGIYPIMVNGASALNYAITYVNGLLTVIPPAVLVIPNTFTPNGDGINDTWKIPALALYPNCSVNIFNRYGANVYHSIGYGTPWNGTYNGKDVPVGVYYYVIDTQTLSIKASGSLMVIK